MGSICYNWGMKNTFNSEINRQCHRCKQVLPATSDFFGIDKSRPLGLAYECRECHRARKKGRENRSDRWFKHTPEQRQKVVARQKKYNQTDKGRAVALRNSYKKIDSCDLTTKEVYELIVQPCVHCGTIDTPRGLDRIDNDLPHIKGNVLPSCAPCNFARGDRFSFAEMQKIGAVIRQVIKDRKTNQVQHEDRP